jgi:hypothetical protein
LTVIENNSLFKLLNEELLLELSRTCENVFEPYQSQISAALQAIADDDFEKDLDESQIL